MAEGSLSAAAEERMRAAMSQDASLAGQVAAARALKRDLAALRSAPVPRGLWWRLWRIPNAGRKRTNTIWMPAGALVTALVVVIGANLYLQGPEPALDQVAQQEAVEDFVIAVAYLQKSALMARNEVNEAVGSSVLSALAVSRGIMDRSETGISEGEGNDED